MISGGERATDKNQKMIYSDPSPTVADGVISLFRQLAAGREEMEPS